jgi:sugar phosphate isomerase/epimerase
MVKLAFSTNAYVRYDLPETVHRIADHGYAGVEVLGDDPHAYFPAFDADDRRALRDALAESGLGVSNVNANTAMGYYDDAPPSAFFEPSLCTRDDARAWRVEYTKRAIDLADAVDAPAVCVASGQALPGNPPGEAYDYLLDALHEVLDHADERGVDVGVEFEPELLVENVAETLALVDDVGRDRLGVNLDLGHAAVTGTDPAEAIRRCARHLTGVHLEDIAGGVGGKHYHLVPGDGDLDFRGVFDALDDAGYGGWVTLELYTYPDDPDGAAGRALDALADYA